MYKLIGTNSVQRLSDGATIPFVNGNIDYEDYKNWIEIGNIPEPEFNSDELNKKRIADIKSKASEIILNKYSEIQQRNILMSQNNEIISEMNLFITAIRNISNQAEADGDELFDIDWNI